MTTLTRFAVLIVTFFIISSMGHKAGEAGDINTMTHGLIWNIPDSEQAENQILSPTTAQKLEIQEWENLLDENLDKWDIFMGAPHTSNDIKGYEKFDDVTKGVPIGLNKDPKNVFTVEKNNGEVVLRISGEIYAGLVTKKEFGNYHLKWEFKWGDKKWEPRLNAKRNSGILYHSVGDFTDFWNVWMTSLECEVQQTDCGDFITLGDVKAQSPSVKKDGKYYFKAGANRETFSWGNGCETGRCFKPGDPEKSHGQWNTMELLCMGNRSIHVLNGKVVMVVVDPLYKKNDEWLPMNKGKIQLQSEAAEIFYKNIRIKRIIGFPEQYRIEAGL